CPGLLGTVSGSLRTRKHSGPTVCIITVLSPGSSEYDTYRVGKTSCSRDRSQSWQCNSTSSSDPLNVNYLRSTAFKLGRQEVVDGEKTQVVLFYNPGQQAWYAWWVGSETGY